MAREYDHLFKLLIIGDSGKNLIRPLFVSHAVLNMYYMCSTDKSVWSSPCLSVRLIGLS